MNGWFTEAELFSFESITVPVANWYVADDQVCPLDVNKALGDSIPTQDTRLTFTNGVDHFGLIAQDDSAYNSLLLGVLNGVNSDLDGTCGSIDIGDWA